MNAIKSEWTLVTIESNNIQNNPSIALIPPPRTTVIVKGDSAATYHYWALQDTMVLDDVRDDTNGPTVILPDISTLTATKRVDSPSPTSRHKQELPQFLTIYRIVSSHLASYVMIIARFIYQNTNWLL